MPRSSRTSRRRSSAGKPGAHGRAAPRPGSEDPRRDRGHGRRRSGAGRVPRRRWRPRWPWASPPGASTRSPRRSSGAGERFRPSRATPARRPTRPRSAPRSTTRSSTRSRPATSCATATCSRSTPAWCSTAGWPTRPAPTRSATVSPIAARLIDVTRASLDRGIAACRIGNRVGDIGHAVQTEVEAAGLLGGAEPGRATASGARCTRSPRCRTSAVPAPAPSSPRAYVIAIEPMVNAGGHDGDPGRRRLDHHHPGRQPLGPLGAHGRRHRRRAEDPHTGLRSRCAPPAARDRVAGMRALRNLLVSLVALGAAASAAQAATIPVTTTSDVTANDGLCSLREAVFAARLDTATPTLNCTPGSGDDLIQLEAGEYRAGGAGGDDGNLSGDFDTGPADHRADRGPRHGRDGHRGVADRVFDVQQGAGLGLGPDGPQRDRPTRRRRRGSAQPRRAHRGARGVREQRRRRRAPRRRPSIEPDGEPGGGGGAIWSSGQLLVSSSVFSGNRAGRGADGRHFEVRNGTTTSSRDVNPRPGGSGGAILVAGGNAAITGSTFSGSRAGTGGDLPAKWTTRSGGAGGRRRDRRHGRRRDRREQHLPGEHRRERHPAADRLRRRHVGRNGGAVAAVAPERSRSRSPRSRATPSAPVSPGRAAWVHPCPRRSSAGPSWPMPPARVRRSRPPSSPTSRCPGTSAAPVAGSPALRASAHWATTADPPPPSRPARAASRSTRSRAARAPGRTSGVPAPALGACDAGAVEIQPGTPPRPASEARAAGGRRRGPPQADRPQDRPAAFRAVGSKPLGTTITFRLSAASQVVLTVQKVVAGKAGRRCLAPSGGLGAPSGARKRTLPGRSPSRGRSGLNLMRFSGRLRGRPLAPGPYTLALTLPRLGAAKAVTTTRAFRILR